MKRALALAFTLGFLSAAAWAVITPTFQVPDEIPHVGYVEYLAETGRVPRPFDTTPGHYQPAADVAIAAAGVPFAYFDDPSWDPGHDAIVKQQLAQHLNRVNEPAAGAAATYPPLYYAIEALPYRAASSGDFFDRLLAMRLFSALLLGATTTFTVLFLRELLPTARSGLVAGAVAIAFQPVAAFVSGGVNPDALLWAASAALTWLIARGFRRGLSLPVALGIGLAVAAALLTKGAAFGLVPGAALALVILAWRGRAPLVAAAGAAVAAVPFAVWLLASSRQYGRAVATTTAGLTHAPRATVGGQLSYIWQIFLPRLPFMSRQFPHGYPLWRDFFQGFVGRFGYFEYDFSNGVDYFALAVAMLVLALAGVALARSRPALSRRFLELLCYATLAAGTLLVIAVAGYHYTLSTGYGFLQTRYLFPLLPLYAALLALAVRGAGRRFGGAFAVLLAVALVAQDVFSMLLSMHRYYTL